MIEKIIHTIKKVQEFDSSIPPELKGTIPEKSGKPKGVILPLSLYKGTRQNIEKICDQINIAYDYGIYDDCSVLMRKLLEMLIISTFKHLNLQDTIKDSEGQYFSINKLSEMAKQNKKIDLSQSAKKNLKPPIEKGHLSAHAPFFNARKLDMDATQLAFRQLVEELLYKSGIIN